jgi:tRNA threonylcarbamoyl adenosine modification protein YeaZ
MHLDPTRYSLAIHTTSPELGLALSNFASDSRSQAWELGRSLSTHLHQKLVEFIQPQKWADLAFLAVAKGPGGFTGTRIGVVTARTLAQQLDIPLYAISSLAVVARSESMVAGEIPIAVQLAAQRGQVYAAIYQSTPDGSVTALLTDTVLTLEAWQQTLTSWPTPYKLIQAAGGLGASVSHLLELAYLEWQQGEYPHWSEALPFYGQHPVEGGVGSGELGVPFGD